MLVIHRIPCRKSENASTNNKEKPVALIQHGILGASDNWLMGGPHSLRMNPLNFPHDLICNKVVSYIHPGVLQLSTSLTKDSMYG